MTDPLAVPPFVEALGVTLLEFLLQGTVVALLLGAFLALVPAAHARLRYAASCLALAALLAIPAVRFSAALETERAVSQADAPLAARAPKSTGSAPVADGTAPQTAARESLAPARREPRGAAALLAAALPASLRARLLPWVVALWAAGVAFASARLLAGFAWTLRLRRRLTRLGDVEGRLVASLAARLGVKRALSFGSSALVEVPTVVGWLRPVLLVPASALTGLTTAQLEALLAHELAHVRRHDALVNLLQSIVETLLFYHPAVWWVSRRIRDERENCCDDVAVAATGDRLSYARALVALEDLRANGAGAPVLALGANGGSLLDRVRRLVETPTARRSSGLAAAGVAALLLGGAVTHGAFDGPAGAFGRADRGDSRPGTPAAAKAPVTPRAPVAARPVRAAAPALAPEAEHVVVRAGAAAPALEDDAEEDLPAVEAEDPETADAEDTLDASPRPDGLPSVEELIALRQRGITAEFLEEMGALGYGKTPIRELIRMRDVGITPAYIRDLKAAGYSGLSASTLVELRNHGVTPDFARAFTALGYARIGSGDLVRLATHGVRPEWVREMQELGYSDLSVEDLIRLRNAGVMPDFVRRVARSK